MFLLTINQMTLCSEKVSLIIRVTCHCVIFLFCPNQSEVSDISVPQTLFPVSMDAAGAVARSIYMHSMYFLPPGLSWTKQWQEKLLWCHARSWEWSSNNHQLQMKMLLMWLWDQVHRWADVLKFYVMFSHTYRLPFSLSDHLVVTWDLKQQASQ